MHFRRRRSHSRERKRSRSRSPGRRNRHRRSPRSHSRERYRKGKPVKGRKIYKGKYLAISADFLLDITQTFRHPFLVEIRRDFCDFPSPKTGPEPLLPYDCDIVEFSQFLIL